MAMLEHLQALATHCYYAGELDAGRRACERILSIKDVDQQTAQTTRQNRTWYTPAIRELADVQLHRIDVEPAHPGWSLFNPTLLTHGGDLLAIVRSSNYAIRDGRYVIPPADGQTIRTENLLIRFGADSQPVSCRRLAWDYPKTDYPVDGLEDCRLRSTATGVGISATIRNASPFDGRCRIAVGDVDLTAAAVTNLKVLDGLNAQTHEKNWMPIEGRGGWLYACHHGGHVVTVDADPDLAGGWQLVQRAEAPPIASQFRGGSQLIPWRGGYLCLVHEVAHVNGQRTYEHRFVWFDEQLRISRLSQPFWFQARQIEFAAGLASLDGRLVASFGVQDAEAWLMTITEEAAWSLLRPVTAD